MSIVETRCEPPIICNPDCFDSWDSIQLLLAAHAATCKQTVYTQGKHPLPPIQAHPESAYCIYTITVMPDGSGTIGISPANPSGYLNEADPEGNGLTQYRGINLGPGEIGFFIAEKEGDPELPDSIKLHAVYEYQPNETAT